MALLALLMAGGAVGCSKQRIQAGNLQERREKKREIKEAQQEALEKARAEEEAAAAARASGEDQAEDTAADGAEPAEPEGEATAPAAAVAPAAGSADTAVEDELPHDAFRITIRDPDGTTSNQLLIHPQVGYYHRTFRSNGQVVDREIFSSSFIFIRGEKLFKVKMHKLARLEVLQENSSRSGTRLRFHFKKPSRKAEEYPVAELKGSTHPRPPFLFGTGARGAQIFPLYEPPGEEKGEFRSVVEVDFVPES